MTETYLALGIIAGLNAIIIVYKFMAQSIWSGLIDLGVMITMTSMSGATLGGMIIMLPASLMVSIFLFFKPPKFKLLKK